MSVRKFNAEAASLDDKVVIPATCPSRSSASRRRRHRERGGHLALRDDSFAKNYNVTIVDGLLAGVFSRSVVVIEENGVGTRSRWPKPPRSPTTKPRFAAAK